MWGRVIKLEQTLMAPTDQKSGAAGPPPELEPEELQAVGSSAKL